MPPGTIDLMRLPVLWLTLSWTLAAEVHTLTLRQAVELADKQNPEILMARIEEQKAAASVREAKDPFVPKLFVGSGLAYTSGFPMSIDGSAPSVVQARALQTLYNRPLSFQVASVRENARGAAFDTEARREASLHQVVSMYLAAERAARVGELVRQQLASFGKIAEAVRARVEEGRELPIEARAADLRVAQARQRLRVLESEAEQAEAALAVVLGFGADNRVRASAGEREPVAVAKSESAAVEEALGNSKQVKRLESALHAKQLQARAERSARYPQIDLVAQYALMARFNNYEEFFRRFQRNNWQLGMSFTLPVFAGIGSKAREEQADLELTRLRLQMNAVRDRLALDTKNAWQSVQVAESARELAKLDLDVTRERLGVALAQFEEGRTPLRTIEELRSLESEKWLTFFDAQTLAEQARYDLLYRTGNIITSLR
jgi:outer membrane protein TolC